jgi:hypothetical protein
LVNVVDDQLRVELGDEESSLTVKLHVARTAAICGLSKSVVKRRTLVSSIVK